MWWHDEEFTGITPGLVGDESTPRRRVRGHVEWRGTVAPWFTPPQDVSAAQAGTVVDQKVDPRDISAMIVSLMLRGWFSLGRTDDGKDWAVTFTTTPPKDALTPAETHLLSAMSPDDYAWAVDHGKDATPVTVALRSRRGPMRAAMQHVRRELRADMRRRGWVEGSPTPFSPDGSAGSDGPPRGRPCGSRRWDFVAT